jgi:hypothetical protein
VSHGRRSLALRLGRPIKLLGGDMVANLADVAPGHHQRLARPLSRGITVAENASGRADDAAHADGRRNEDDSTELLCVFCGIALREQACSGRRAAHEISASG